MIPTKLQPDYQWIEPSGTAEILTVLCRWADHKTRLLPTREAIDAVLTGNRLINPGSTVKNYFREQSKGRLEISFKVTDWLDVPFTEDQARGQLDSVIQYLLKLKPIELTLSPNSPLILLHSGYDQVFRNSPGVIWSSLGFQPLIPGQNEPLQRYVISSAIHGIQGNIPLRPALISHEVAHCFGLPHHFLADGEPYCLMVNMWTYSPGLQYVAQLCRPCRDALGWLEPVPVPPVTDKLGAFNLMPNPMIPDNVLLANEVTIERLRKAVNP